MFDLAARHWLASTVLLSLSGIAVYYMRLDPGASALVGSYVKMIARRERFQFPDSDIMLRTVYTGVGPLDLGLSFLVAAFLPGASGMSRSFQLQQAHLLFSFLPVVAVTSIEAARGRNAGSNLIYTSVWSFLYQTIGGAVILPLWYLLFLIKASGPGYYAQKRAVSPAKAKALLPALLVGYVLPTALAFYPFESMDTRQLMVAVWQPCPLYVNLIWWALSAMSQKPQANVRDADLPHLRRVYFSSVTISALAHLVAVWQTCTSTVSGVNLWHVFVPTNQVSWSMNEALLFIFQIDFWVIFAASVFSGYFMLWEMRRSGVMQADLGSVSTGPPLWTALLGPGAMVAVIWWWREEVMRERESRDSDSIK